MRTHRRLKRGVSIIETLVAAGLISKPLTGDLVWSIPTLATINPVNGHRFLPTGGHEIPHWWASFLPMVGRQISRTRGHRISPPGVCWGSGQRRHHIEGRAGRSGHRAFLRAASSGHAPWRDTNELVVGRTGTTPASSASSRGS